MSYQWLENPDNQNLVYAMCEQAIEDLAPDEVPLFEELFPNYVEMAQRGEVTTGARASGPFSLTGGEDLITFLIIPIVIDIAASVLASSGSTVLHTIRMRASRSKIPNEEQDVLDADVVRKFVAQQLRKTKALPASEDETVQAITEAILNVFASLEQHSGDEPAE